jgi:hypothetical protein
MEQPLNIVKALLLMIPFFFLLIYFHHILFSDNSLSSSYHSGVPLLMIPNQRSLLIERTHSTHHHIITHQRESKLMSSSRTNNGGSSDSSSSPIHQHHYYTAHHPQQHPVISSSSSSSSGIRSVSHPRTSSFRTTVTQIEPETTQQQVVNDFMSLSHLSNPSPRLNKPADLIDKFQQTDYLEQQHLTILPPPLPSTMITDTQQSQDKIKDQYIKHQPKHITHHRQSSTKKIPTSSTNSTTTSTSEVLGSKTITLSTTAISSSKNKPITSTKIDVQNFPTCQPLTVPTTVAHTPASSKPVVTHTYHKTTVTRQHHVHHPNLAKDHHHHNNITFHTESNASSPYYDIHPDVFKHSYTQYPNFTKVLVPTVFEEYEKYGLPPWITNATIREKLGYDVFLYQRTNKSAPNYVRNRGTEGAVYLRYIVDHYDNFPDVAIFTHAFPWDHNPYWWEQIGCIKPTASYMNINFREISRGTDTW